MTLPCKFLMSFVLVNGRTPCSQSSCVMCDQSIGASYLREVGTRLPRWSGPL